LIYENLAMERPELFFGLIGAVGTSSRKIGEVLGQNLRKMAYDPEIIRLSNLLTECHKYKNLSSLADGPEDQRINSLMEAGNDFRRTAERGDAVALLGLGKIRNLRDMTEKAEGPKRPRAYILDSLKHPAEVDLLRKVYGPAFFAVSVYAPRAHRQKSLCESISRSRRDYDKDKYIENAAKLMQKDEQEYNEEFGQNVRDTFPLADIFIDVSNEARSEAQIKRFLEILFGHPFRTPTKDEYGLFHAKAVALRSADLSRQVGSVILTAEGEVISAGCNEVPKSGGGFVWEDCPSDKELDHRDFTIQHDSTARMKHEILDELFSILRDKGWLSPEKKALEPKALSDLALYDNQDPILKGTRVTSIIEFGRIVHAEMSAITDAARLGRSVKGAILYCTTFPCHMCARHIIAAGISRVVYIEPYPKSMAIDLYSESIHADRGGGSDEGAVVFEPFVGVSPRRYMDFFEMGKRKDLRGHTLEWNEADSSPRVRQFATYRDLEAVHFDFLNQNRVRLGLVESSNEGHTGGRQ
jgi:cytidine deaminase